MKCITWNVSGIQNGKRWGTVGRYLREWRADFICLQETMLTHTEQRTWTLLGWGSGESQVSIAASGRSGGIILAWKEATFYRFETWRGRHVVAAHLVNKIDSAAIVMALAYGPSARLSEASYGRTSFSSVGCSRIIPFSLAAITT